MYSLHLGIDPSPYNLGIALLAVEGENTTIQYSTTISTSERDNINIAYFEIANKVEDILVENYDITHVTIENPTFIGSASKTKVAIGTQHIVGIVGYLLAKHNLVDNILLLSAKQIKKIFTNSGDASKKEIIEQVNKLFNYKCSTDHEADAIAIAWSGIKYRETNIIV